MKIMINKYIIFGKLKINKIWKKEKLCFEIKFMIIIKNINI